MTSEYLSANLLLIYEYDQNYFEIVRAKYALELKISNLIAYSGIY